MIDNDNTFLVKRKNKIRLETHNIIDRTAQGKPWSPMAPPKAGKPCFYLFTLLACMILLTMNTLKSKFLYTQTGLAQASFIRTMPRHCGTKNIKYYS